MGSNEVIAIGTASVIHQIAIHKAIARVLVISGCPGLRSAKRINDKLIRGAANTPIVFKVIFFFTNIIYFLSEIGINSLAYFFLLE